MTAPGSPSNPKSAMADLRVRVASALVLVAGVVGCLLLGGWFFAAAMGLLAATVSFEWMRMTEPDRARGQLFFLAAFCGAAVFFVQVRPLDVLAAVLAVTLFLLVATLANKGRIWSVLGIVYAVLPAAAMVLFRKSENGLLAVGFLFVVVWATDTVAYFTGRLIGGPKLWPAVSPKKTWSGAIGGLAGGVATGVALLYFAGISNLVLPAGVALVLSMVSALGDLFESAIKRAFGVKDSGVIIPGHGGAMDRVDGLVAAAFLACLIAVLHGLLMDGGVRLDLLGSLLLVW